MKKMHLILSNFMFLMLNNAVYSKIEPQELPANFNIKEGFADVVESRLDAVVNISATIKQTAQSTPDLQLPDGPLREFFQDFFSFYDKKTIPSIKDY